MLRTEGREIGTWPIKYCRVSPSSRGAVMLSLDGEKAGFEPHDVAHFSAAAAQRFRASPLADRVNVIRNLPSAVEDAGDLRPRRDGRRFSFPRRWVGLGLGVIGLFALTVVVLAVASSIDEPAVTGSVPATVAPATAPGLFDQTVDEFAREWNLTATTFGVPVQIRGVLQGPVFESVLSPHVTLQGRTDEAGTIRSVVLVVDPRGDTDDDQLALSALGVAIAVADPSLDREGRAGVLSAMGLDVRDPDLANLDGETVVRGVRYTLTYYEEFTTLLFTVEPG